MAKVELKSSVDVEIKVNIQFTIEEAKALQQIIGYGIDPFLQVFYKYLGAHYLKPYEKGVITLFDTLKYALPPRIGEADIILETVNKLKN